MKFVTGRNPAEDLTDEQILKQCKMYIAAVRLADDFGCHDDRHPVSAGAEGPAAGQRPGRRHAQQHRSPAGAQPRRQPRVVRRAAAAPFQRSRRVRGLDGLMTYRVHRAMGQPVENTLHDLRWGDWDQQRHGRRLRLGVPDQRVGPAGPFRRRLGGGFERAAAADVLPGSAAARSRASPSRAKSSGRESMSRTTACAMDLGRAERGRSAARRDRAPLAGHDAAMADHARGDVRRLPRPDDGPAQGQPHPSRLRQQRRRSRRGACWPRPPWPTNWAWTFIVCGTRKDGEAW